MIIDESENPDGKPPRRPASQINGPRDVALQHNVHAGVLTPLLKSLGWELVGVGAEFPYYGEPRKPTARKRDLFERQVAAQSLMGSSPTASALRS